MSGIIKRLALMAAVLFTAGLFYSAPAAAQATRTWISGVGDDANPCSRTAPCKTFAGAISKTAASGEIDCLDPGGFGAVTLTKSITLDCTGTLGSILASSTTGIIVNGANAVVIIRGLTINGAPITSPGVNGIRVLQAASVTIERVSITGFQSSAPNGFGVIVNNNSANTQVTVLDSTISNNSFGGISVQPVGAFSATLVVKNSRFSGNGGVAVTLTTGNGATSVTGTITDTEMTGSGVASSNGVIAKTIGGTAVVTVTGSTISGMGVFGANSNGPGSIVRIGNSLITNNNTGINSAGGGQMVSLGGNSLVGNPTPGTFTSTVPPL